MKKIITTTLIVIFGNFLYAASVKLFLLPANLMTGGTTGIALFMHHYFGVSISLFTLIFNIIMLIIGYLCLGKAFALTTILSTFTYPIALEILDRLLGNIILTDNLLINAIYSGLGIGLALGIVIRAGASTGGMDIPPLVLEKLFKFPVSISLYLFDFLILIMQAFYNNIEGILYAILLVLIYTIVLDKLMIIGTGRTEIKVISKKYDEIRHEILHHLDRGVTMIEGKGGYLHEPTQIVMSIISNRELPKIEAIIRTIDPEAFVIVSKVTEVHGHGFSLDKQYKEEKE